MRMEVPILFASKVLLCLCLAPGLLLGCGSEYKEQARDEPKPQQRVKDQSAKKEDSQIPGGLWFESWPKAVSNDSELEEAAKTESMLRIGGEDFSVKAFERAFEDKHYQYIMLGTLSWMKDGHLRALKSAGIIRRLDLIFREYGAFQREEVVETWSIVSKMIFELDSVDEIYVFCDPTQWRALPKLETNVVSAFASRIHFMEVPNSLSQRMASYAEALEAGGTEVLINYLGD